MALSQAKNLRHFLKTFQVQRVLSANTIAVAAVKEDLGNVLSEIKEAGLWKPERIITSKQDSAIEVKGSKGKILNFCANNYLGLSSHPDVIEAGKRALDSHGAGLSSVRFICGTQDLHKELEAKIAKFHGMEDAIVYASCFDANAGLFEQILSSEDAVLSDALNHASIIDGIRLCKAQKYRYNHMDMEDLESKLKDAQKCRLRLIASDGVFSMDGNVTPLKEICDLADKYNALVFIDECHATGFFGKTGRGTDEYTGTQGRVDIINSTLGKALGGASGGYTAGPRELTELLRQRSRPYLFSNALPPAVVACAIKVLDMLLEGTNLTAKVLSNTKRFRSKMTAAGFNLGGDPDHPICPVMLGDAKLANQYAEEMLSRDIYVIGFSYPVVPKNTARIRVQISAAHSEEDIDKAVDAFVDIGRKLKVIP
ncbi:2-amino-3-ketobutyrate coenzyme A ligase, mitochondrial-like [Lingula anatina]|uniref:2-amino-3-ketobutyrate coenzyme A ligase, mitochondrial-like n=1 Tax=Lingula anatina TaxID=7574 RepID=A0A1S3I7P8_LINAN|nr:2-amino-3-ketobutyrate coenzyme A ligase, mitochondrial-like [Lingula anatina]|eukprot:XP_013393399.1 2-amino-3-ketobutyrate coenzyme A ligase, mitochondrial-like [Lingula anatina]